MAVAPDRDLGRGTIYDDRHERKGTAFLWRRGNHLCDPGEPLTGQVRWDTPEGYEPVKRSGDEPIESEERYHGSTQVLISNADDPDGEYTVSVNGTLEKPDENGIVYLRNFQGPFRMEATRKTLVGPVSLGVLTKTGTQSPSNVKVSVVQKTVAAMQPLPDNVLSISELPCGNEQSVALPVLNIPFPARFTESPFIEIQSVHRLVEKQAKTAWRKGVGVVVALAIAYLMTVVGGVSLTTLVGAYFGPTVWMAANKAIVTVSGGEAPDAAQARSLFAVIAPILDLLGLDGRFAPLRKLSGAIEAYNKNDPTKPGSLQTADARAKLFATIGSALGKTATSIVTDSSSTKAKKYRKYTIRSLAQTIRNLMREESAHQYEAIRKSAQRRSSGTTVENTSTSVRHASSKRNERVLLDYLRQGSVSDKDTNTLVSSWLQKLGLGILENTPDAQGNAQSGLVFAVPGDAKVRGLDWNSLQKSYATTAIVVEIDEGHRSRRFQIVADEAAGFAAGYHASGLVGDLDDLQQAIDQFKTRHPKETSPPTDDPIPVTAAMEASVALLSVWNLSMQLAKWKNLRDEVASFNAVVAGQIPYLHAGIEKLSAQTREHITTFMQGKENTLYAELMRRAEPIYEHWKTVMPRDDIPFQTYRFRPQRIKATLLVPTFTELDTIGVSGTDENAEELRDSLPISAAFDETRRAGKAYALSMRRLWDRWESSTHTRMLWYNLFQAGKDALPIESSVINVAGSTGVEFCATGQLLPLGVRDRLQWWAAADRNPSLATAVRLISTKNPTESRETPGTRRRADTRSASRSADSETRPWTPGSVTELLAAHAVADALVARVVMRTRLSFGMRVSTTAIESMRQLVPRVIEVLNASRVIDGDAVGAVVAENDPMFACLLGGSDAARILHGLGAWTRRAEVALHLDRGVISLQKDETLEQRLAFHNRWPQEAEEQLRSVLAFLPRASTLPFASMPIYALQNAITDDPDCDSKEVDARLCEALASFLRTQALGEALGISGRDLNPVQLRLVTHWPVTLAAALASKDDAAFRLRVANLQKRVKASDQALKRAPADERVDVELFRMRNATLRVDPKTFEEFDEANYTNYPATRDTRTFFVPFSHGHLPLSRVSSLVHPGSGGIDSAPVHVQHLLRAIRVCRTSKDDEAAVAQVNALSATEGAHPFCIKLKRDDRILAACGLVAATVTHAVGKSTSLPPLNVADAVATVLRGDDVLQHGSLVDVLCWNAERIVQAVLLMVGRVGDTTLLGTVECVPPDPPTPHEARLSTLQTDGELDRYLRRISQDVTDAARRHHDALKDALTSALGTYIDCVDAYVQRKQDELAANPAADADADTDADPDVTDAFMSGVDVDDEAFEDSQRLQWLLDATNTTGAPAAQPTSREAYEEKVSEWDYKRKDAFLTPDSQVLAYSVDDGLAYVCEYEVERAYEHFQSKFEEYAATALAPLQMVVGEDELPKACAIPKLKQFKEENANLRSSQNHVRAMQHDYYEKRARIEGYRAALSERSDATIRQAKLMAKRNLSAFYASTVLASAVLSWVLGEKAAPRLRVKEIPLVPTPQWVGILGETPPNDSDVSLMEAALLLEQAVRDVS